MGLGISGLINDTGSELVENVVDKGISVISEPIKMIIITASILGGIIVLLLAYKYLYKEKQEKANIYMATTIHLHPHIWKKYEEYYEGKKSIN